MERYLERTKENKVAMVSVVLLAILIIALFFGTLLVLTILIS